MLRRDLAQASAGTARESAADLRARFVRAAYKLARAGLDAQTGAVSARHSHVRAMAVERRELFGFHRTQAISTQSASAIAEAAKQFGQQDDITVLTVTLTPL